MAVTLPKLALSIRKGSAYMTPLRVETGNLSFAAITGMSKSAPLRVIAPAHNIPDGWYAAIVDAGGMTEFNAADSNSIQDREFRRTIRVDADTVDFPGTSSANFRDYTSGGYLAFYAPMDLSGYTAATMDVKSKVGGTIVATFSVAAGTLSIDAASGTVWIILGHTALSSVQPKNYVFDIELANSMTVEAICSADSVLSVLPEVTTSA